MLVDVDPSGGFARLDDDALAALHRLADGTDDEADPALTGPLSAAGLAGLLGPVAAPLARIQLTVAGPRARLEHAGWLGAEAVTWVLGVSAGRHQLMPGDPAFVTAALVRLTRIRPRRGATRVEVPFPADRLPDLVSDDEAARSRALADAGAELAWTLAVTWPGGARRLTAVDGPAGLRLADPDTGLLRPASNTFAYRVLSTVLPPDHEPAGSAVAAPLQP